jgi:hypothetical protein
LILPLRKWDETAALGIDIERKRLSNTEGVEKNVIVDQAKMRMIDDVQGVKSDKDPKALLPEPISLWHMCDGVQVGMIGWQHSNYSISRSE